MSNKSTASVATMGIDIGKNSFHVVGLGERGAIVLKIGSQSFVTRR
jgi:transposase